ncbi:hypothetical protein QBC44DRAFT_147537 [Cladorrhinum sp. PSN332]|nr:hypothetical protein QBC44DRAFT_147537 [Cladorrhinum sp. PSN332]
MFGQQCLIGASTGHYRQRKARSAWDSARRPFPIPDFHFLCFSNRDDGYGQYYSKVFLDNHSILKVVSFSCFFFVQFFFFFPSCPLNPYPRTKPNQIKPNQTKSNPPIRCQVTVYLLSYIALCMCIPTYVLYVPVLGSGRTVWGV